MAATQAAHLDAGGLNALMTATAWNMPEVVERLLQLPNAKQQAAVRMHHPSSFTQ
jgi:hypothetical protein